MISKYKPVLAPKRIQKTNGEMIAAADAFHKAMVDRRTIRDYKDDPVAADVIKQCIKTAGMAPSGANHQPWHFVAISNPDLKRQIREAAEKEEEQFYAGGAGDEWISALEPIGTGPSKPHLTTAPWLIVVFAERYGVREDGSHYKNYYVPESVGIATGMLLTALHMAGLSTLTHTPNPMAFLTEICGQPRSNKPTMIITVGHQADSAEIPEIALKKKPLEGVLTLME
jgi:iodotyrosine deiodinase